MYSHDIILFFLRSGATFGLSSLFLDRFAQIPYRPVVTETRNWPTLMVIYPTIPRPFHSLHHNFRLHTCHSSNVVSHKNKLHNVLSDPLHPLGKRTLHHGYLRTANRSFSLPKNMLSWVYNIPSSMATDLRTGEHKLKSGNSSLRHTVI